MRHTFSLIALVIIFITFPFFSLAQSNLMDVVYLKNGSIIKGIIVEQVPGTAIKIQTADGSLFVFEISEITKMTRMAAPITSAPVTAAPKDRDEWGRSYNQNMDLARRRKSASIGLLSAGSVLVAGGVALLVYGILNTHQQGYYLVGGGAATVVGIPLLAIGGGLWSAQLKYRRRAENMASGTAQLSPTLIGTQRFSGAHVQSGSAVGLQLTFRF